MASPSSRTESGSIYSIHPGVVMVQKWVAELPAKTGRSLDEWIEQPKRLVPTGGKDKRDRITHRIAITSPEQIDEEVKRWIKTAYELDA